MQHIVFLIVPLAMLWVGCGREKNSREGVFPVEYPATSAYTLNLGARYGGSDVPFVVELKNTSPEPLQISEIVKSCSCTDVVPESNLIEGGHSVRLRGHLVLPQSEGPAGTEFRVYFTSSKMNPCDFRISYDVKSSFNISPATAVSLTRKVNNNGRTSTETVSIYLAKKLETAKLVQAKLSLPGVKALSDNVKIESLPDKECVKISLGETEQPCGNYQGTLTVKTNDDVVEPSIEIPLDFTFEPPEQCGFEPLDACIGIVRFIADNAVTTVTCQTSLAAPVVSCSHD